MATAAAGKRIDYRPENKRSASGAPLRFIPQLDGLRACAILLVIGHHYGLSRGIGAGAEFGVRLFFVLSGFLITGIILRHRPANGVAPSAIGAFLLYFYARRALRLMPVFYLGLAAGAALGIAPLLASWPWHALYLSNVYFAMAGGFQYPIGHLWTLAVEEQFYLLWPLAALLIPRRHLPRSVAALIVAAPLFRLTGGLMGFDRVPVGILLPSCLDTLGCGALLAIVDRDHPALLAGAGRRPAVAVAVLATILLLAIELLRDAAPLLHFAFGDTIRAALAAWIVHRAVRGFGGVAGRVLESRAMQSIGKTSYCLYIVHQPAYFLIRRLFETNGLDHLPQTMIAAVAFVVSLAASLLSWLLLEEPISRLKRHFPIPAGTAEPAAAGRSSARRHRGQCT